VVDFSGLTVIVLLGLVLLRGVLLAIGAALILRPIAECPACFEPGTFLLRRRWLRWLAPWLEWRFCARCGWQGPAKKAEPGAPLSQRRPPAPEPHPFPDEPESPLF
jgi:hypothetical protein